MLINLKTRQRSQIISTEQYMSLLDGHTQHRNYSNTRTIAKLITSNLSLHANICK